MSKLIYVTESVQCGDNILHHFICPTCNSAEFQSYPFGTCSICTDDFAFYFVSVEKQRRRLVVGTKRKQRPLKKKQIEKLLLDQANKCAYCYKDLDLNYHIEHIKPISFGGSNLQHNLAISCPPCNLTASSLVFPDFYAKQAYLLNKFNMGNEVC